MPGSDYSPRFQQFDPQNEAGASRPSSNQSELSHPRSQLPPQDVEQASLLQPLLQPPALPSPPPPLQPLPPQLVNRLLKGRSAERAASGDLDRMLLPGMRNPPEIWRAAGSKGPVSKGSAGKGRPAAAPIQGISRQRDKFVPLPETYSPHVTTPGDEPAGATPPRPTTPPDMDDLQAAAGGSGQQLASPAEVLQPLDLGALESPHMPPKRITAYCFADSMNRKTLESILRSSYKPHQVQLYSDVAHLKLEDVPGQGPGGSSSSADVFFFTYGVVVTYGLSQQQELDILAGICTLCAQGLYRKADMEVDEFKLQHSGHAPPHIQNDTFTINLRQQGNHQVRLAISHALAQSSKLAVYEERVWGLVEETKHLPEALARDGRVNISTKAVAQLIGKVFLQSSNVNLLSSVLDTPDWFWDVQDSLQALYDRACEYLEIDSRTELLNARFEVLQEMLDMLRDHQNNFHASRLEWIIIWLLVVDVVLMMFQLASLFGLV